MDYSQDLMQSQGLSKQKRETWDKVGVRDRLENAVPMALKGTRGQVWKCSASTNWNGPCLQLLETCFGLLTSRNVNNQSVMFSSTVCPSFAPLCLSVGMTLETRQGGRGRWLVRQGSQAASPTSGPSLLPSTAPSLAFLISPWFRRTELLELLNYA